MVLHTELHASQKVWTRMTSTLKHGCCELWAQGRLRKPGVLTHQKGACAGRPRLRALTSALNTAGTRWPNGARALRWQVGGVLGDPARARARRPRGGAGRSGRLGRLAERRAGPGAAPKPCHCPESQL